jgi:light-regulated signal transduction histidine kinase (bacteriophytochrome)
MHLLIIDDIQADHDIAVECLEDAGGAYRFYHAYSVEEGLEICRAQPIECVLLDYHMPGQNGLEMLKQLAQGERMMPVIMMTGEGDEFVAVTAMKLGSQDYIPKKTITPSALKRAVDRAVKRTEMIRRMEQYRTGLERSNHDLEQFANIVAHDLKSPLRAVTQHLTLIRNKHLETLDEKSRCSLEFAVEGAWRMRLLIDALFEYARLGFSEPHFDTVSLESVLEQTKRDLCAIIDESGAQITHDPLPEVKGDSILLAQLLQNLIANAIKYCKETPCIHISAVQEGDGWRIGVRDNGIGIPTSQHQQIFAIFRRLHQESDYPGLGLGLAICDRIVKQHGGAIGIESQPGKGSVFYFTLLTPQAGSTQEKRVNYG